MVKVASWVPRLVEPGARRMMRIWWTAALHAHAQRVGPQVHLYGPVRFLGTRRVTLGGYGNLYDQVLFETIDGGSIVIGDFFRINRGSLLSAHAGIMIGNGCLIGEYVSIRDNNHVFDDPTVAIGEQGFRARPISIADDVWIGRGAVVLPGVSIGRGAVIAANSVVTKDVPSLEIWAGIPAKLLRHRGSERR